MKLVSCIYVEWSKKVSELRIQRKRKYAERFVEKVNNYRYESESLKGSFEGVFIIHILFNDMGMMVIKVNDKLK